MVVANWKMYTRASDAYILATSIRNSVASLDGVEVVVCPPVIWLSELSEILKRDGKVNLGAQNMFYEDEGPYTGEISPIMIRDVCKYVIVGHSERRAHFGETDFDVNEKVLAALKHGLSPIICVGEKTKSAPLSDAADQLEEALTHVPKNKYKDIVVAYEPVWAIGNHNAAPVEHAEKAVAKLREVIFRESPILYGGSIDHEKILNFAKSPLIDGVLVGSASLRASVFVEICRIWAANKSFKGDVVIPKEVDAASSN